MELPKVLIRRYRPGDEESIRKVVSRATMETVGPFFLSAAGKEGIIQSMLMVAAVLFIVVGTTLQQSLVAVPFVLVALYAGLYLGHWAKIVKTHKDLDDVAVAYPDGSKRGFWVAVLVDGEKCRNRRAAVAYEFCSEGDAADGMLARSLRPTTERLIGTVAIDVKEDPDMKEPPGSVALLRRLAVSGGHRRRGVATALLEAGLEHCLARTFRAVELVTTEHHQALRYLYANRGFELQNTRKQVYLGGMVTLKLHRLRVACSTIQKRNDDEDDI